MLVFHGDNQIFRDCNKWDKIYVAQVHIGCASPHWFIGRTMKKLRRGANGEFHTTKKEMCRPWGTLSRK